MPSRMSACDFVRARLLRRIGVGRRRWCGSKRPADDDSGGVDDGNASGNVSGNSGSGAPDRAAAADVAAAADFGALLRKRRKNWNARGDVASRSWCSSVVSTADSMSSTSSSSLPCSAVYAHDCGDGDGVEPSVELVASRCWRCVSCW